MFWKELSIKNQLLFPIKLLILNHLPTMALANQEKKKIFFQFANVLFLNGCSKRNMLLSNWIR